MLEAYPTKKWFVVLGDDNYVLLDNYVNVLSAFDPEQPWALSRMVHRNKFGCKVRSHLAAPFAPLLVRLLGESRKLTAQVRVWCELCLVSSAVNLLSVSCGG